VSIRTNRTTVVFARPFAVIGLDALQPAGTYTVETHDELFDGVSLPGCRRIGTSIFLPARPARAGWAEVAQIDPRELDAATNTSRHVPRRDNSDQQAGHPVDVGSTVQALRSGAVGLQKPFRSPREVRFI
jgi:hypothetical protein